MGKTGISVRNLNGVQRWLLGLVPKTKLRIKQVTEATIRLMEADAKRRAPVRFGKLRQSIHAELTKNGFGGTLSANVLYWAYVEFGTGGLVEIPEGFEDLASEYKGDGKLEINIPAQPFLIPAWLKYKDQYYKAISDALNDIFR